MINTPESNIKLTDNQTKAIDIANQKLVVIQNEIAVATKVLNSTKNDSIVATKEKLWQEELLSDIKSKTNEAQSKLDVINTSITTQGEILSSINQEIAQKSISLNSKEMELKDREDNVSKKEEEVFSRQEELSQKEVNHEEISKRFKRKVEMLKEVITQF